MEDRKKIIRIASRESRLAVIQAEPLGVEGDGAAVGYPLRDSHYEDNG